VLREQKAFDRPHVVILRERGGARELPIWVGAPAAIAMAITLESQQMPRPMTYQFAADVLDAARARVVSVRITTLVENTR
jgi:bifunctional DNase/RNase